MPLTTESQLKELVNKKQVSVDVFRPNVTSLAGALVSRWVIGGGVAPTAAVVYTTSSAGAIPLPSAGVGETRHATYVSYGTTADLLPYFLYDRLIASGGLNGTLATAQTTNLTAFPAIPRGDTTGLDVQLFLEVYAALGATAVTATISYTNENGVAGKIGTCSIPASTPTGSMIPVALANGDYGVRSVQSVTLSATTGLAGNFGVTLLRQIHSGAANYSIIPVDHDWLETSLFTLPTDTCLQAISLAPAGTVSGTFMGLINIVMVT